MKLTAYQKISLNVIAVFATAMLLSFIPDYLHNFFDDTYCIRLNQMCGEMANKYSEPHWHWGYRHWLWILMGISLFIIQAIRFIILVNKEIDKQKQENRNT